MPQTQITITYVDPRYLDGDPYEVAGKAVTQARAAAKLLERALQDSNVMARNAQMERDLHAGEDPSAALWEGSPQGLQFAALGGDVEELAHKLVALQRAASFDPRKT